MCRSAAGDRFEDVGSAGLRATDGVSRLAALASSACANFALSAMVIHLAAYSGCKYNRAGAVLHTLRCSPSVSPSNNSILITGLGAVGMAALFAAVYLKLGTIIVVDVVASRLELARELGATVAINGREESVADRVREETKGLGARWAVEATGNVKVRLAHPCGGWPERAQRRGYMADPPREHGLVSQYRFSRPPSSRSATSAISPCTSSLFSPSLSACADRSSGSTPSTFHFHLAQLRYARPRTSSPLPDP